MDEKRLCQHKRWVKWFPQSELPVYNKEGKRLAYHKEVVFKGCLDCGKVIVEDYGE